MADRKIYTVELDGQQYEIEGDRPPTEAEVRSTVRPPSAAPANQHPEAHMGPAGPVDPKTDAVTLRDVMDDPVGAVKRIGAIVKADVSDPKVWAGLAAAYLGPKLFEAAGPMISKAASATAKGAIKSTAALGDAVDPDIIGIISPRAGKAVQMAQKLNARINAPAAETPAPVEAAPPKPTLVKGAANAVPRPMPAKSGNALNDAMGVPTENPGLKSGAFNAAMEDAVRAKTGQPLGQAITALTKQKFTASEISQGIKWLQQGVDADTIAARLVAMRSASGSGGPFAGLPSNSAVSSAVAARNASGRWSK